MDAVRTWADRLLDRLSAVPELGSPAWVALADTDARKLAAAIRPALAYMVEGTPAAVGERLRAELDERATAWRRSLAELHADLSTGWHERGYSVGPSHAELERRRYTFPCGQCRRPLPLGVGSCGQCGWREPTPAELRARAYASWARYARRSTTPFDEQGCMTTHPTEYLTGAELLDVARTAITRYVSLPSAETADAVVLWIAATHAQPAWAHAPRLVIRAPEKRCGKSRLLDLIEATCHNPFITVNSSPAAVYRSISEDPPTMLVDEADTIFGPKADGNEDLRGLLNAGHQRNRPAKRYDAASNSVESIPTFAMAALAGIGAMPDTIEDRAVIVRMRRRAPGETVAPFRHRRDRPGLRAIAHQLTAWLRADLTELEAALPAMPVEDRAADTWEPLVIVADHAGGHWPDRARAAVLALTADADENGEQSIRVRLLVDCHAAFDYDTALPTSELLARLKRDVEAPWLTYGVNGLTAAKLGSLLREYGIRSANIRFADGTQAKGYQRTHFEDAWMRYCPGITTDLDAGETSQPSHTSPPRSARDTFTVWDGTSRPNTPPDEPPWDGLARPAKRGRPGSTSQGTTGTTGTTTPLRQIPGGAA